MEESASDLKNTQQTFTHYIFKGKKVRGKCVTVLNILADYPDISKKILFSE
jgi:hypothetical protein